jgi:hypothetical protein
MVFQLLLSEKKKQVLALLLVPLGYVLLITAIVLGIPSLPEFESWLLMIGSLLASLLTIVYLFRKLLLVACEVKIGEHGISIRFLRRSLFYPKRERFISWSNIHYVQKEFSPDAESIEIGTQHPLSRLLFQSRPGKLTELFSFFNAVNVHVSLYNRKLATEGRAESRKNFFDSVPARIIAFLLVLAMAFCTAWLAWDPGTWKVYAWLRLTYLYLLGLPFLYKVIARRKKSRL